MMGSLRQISWMLQRVEVVLRILRFPVAVRQVEGVNDFAVGGYSSFLRCVVCLFAEECEIGLVAVVLEQPLECGTDGAFVLFAEPFVFFEFGIVVSDRFVCRFDVEVRHG